MDDSLNLTSDQVRAAVVLALGSPPDLLAPHNTNAGDYYNRLTEFLCDLYNYDVKRVVELREYTYVASKARGCPSFRYTELVFPKGSGTFTHFDDATESHAD